MARYVAGRIFQLVIVIVGVLLVVFVVLHLVADPARMTLPLGSTQEQIDAFNEAHGLNDPLYVQVRRFFANAIKGDFGTSLLLREDALGAALQRLPATVLLTFPPVIGGGLLGLLLGAAAARRPNSALDHNLNTFSYGVSATADFWIAIMLVLLFAVRLPLLPTGGYDPKPQVLILPWLVLALGPFAQLFQLTRSTMGAEYGKQYVLAAYARGLSERSVASGYVLPNVLLPCVTMLMHELARVFIGTAIVVEVVFAWPGLGRLAADAVGRGDIFLVEALVLVGAVATATLNLVADLLYFAIDPRTRVLVSTRQRAKRWVRT